MGVAHDTRLGQLKAVDELDRRVSRAGGHLTLQGSRLRVIQPDGGLDAELRSASVEQRGALIQWLTSGRLLLPEEQERHEMLTDPYWTMKDSPLWSYAFRRRYELHGADDELLHVLRMIRTAGARMVRRGRDVRIVPGDSVEAEWPTIREQWLAPHEGDLRTLFQDAQSGSATTIPEAGETSPA